MQAPLSTITSTCVLRIRIRTQVHRNIAKQCETVSRRPVTIRTLNIKTPASLSKWICAASLCIRLIRDTNKTNGYCKYFVFVDCCSFPLSPLHTLFLSHRLTHPHTHTRATCTPTHTHMHTCTNAHMHKRTHAHTCTHMHTHSISLSYTHTRTLFISVSQR